MANQDAVGKSGPAFSFEVEKGKVREFARATGSSNEAYWADDAPMPPTFPMAVAFWQPPDVGNLLGPLKLDLRRILHGEQHFEYVGPPPTVGTRLTARATVESITEKEGKRGGTMTIVNVVTELSDDSGAVRARTRNVLIETGKAPG